MILNHIFEGIEIAKRNNLPDRVIDFIRIIMALHHTLFSTRQENEDIDKTCFAMGPKPYSKETAILMMAIV